MIFAWVWDFFDLFWSYCSQGLHVIFYGILQISMVFYGILKYSSLLYCFLVYYYLYSDVMVGMAFCKQQPRPETSTNPCFLHKSRMIGSSPSMSLLLFHLFLAMFANLQSDHFWCPALALLVQVYLAGACNWWIMATVFWFYRQQIGDIGIRMYTRNIYACN